MQRFVGVDGVELRQALGCGGPVNSVGVRAGRGTVWSYQGTRYVGEVLKIEEQNTSRLKGYSLKTKYQVDFKDYLIQG